MTRHEDAARIAIEADEDGLFLVVVDEGGEWHEFPIAGMGPDELFRQLAAATAWAADWRNEEQQARATRPGEVDLDGYEPGDPKRTILEREAGR